VETNIDFMRRILQSKAFRDTIVTTKFIEENKEELLKVRELTKEQLAIATLALSAINDCKMDANGLVVSRFRMNADYKTNFTVKDGDAKAFDVGVVFSNAGGEARDFTIGGIPHCRVLNVEKKKEGAMFTIEVQVGDKKVAVNAALAKDTNVLSVFTPEGSFRVEVPTLGPKDRSHFGESGSALSGLVNSPMPGTLEKVAVKEGDAVAKGQQLGTLVAMKMEHVIRAPCDGTVEKIHQSVGKTVAKGSHLFTVTPAAS